MVVQSWIRWVVKLWALWTEETVFCFLKLPVKGTTFKPLWHLTFNRDVGGAGVRWDRCEYVYVEYLLCILYCCNTHWDTNIFRINMKVQGHAKSRAALRCCCEFAVCKKLLKQQPWISPSAQVRILLPTPSFLLLPLSAVLSSQLGPKS